ncbi:MAG: hypothetical protein NPINA01_32320 [Nitrospinaceae bacterium]|nr:MAG: hypothetical protein NPINA01_32320 [Nitrospinaceae bacterium]
MHVRLEYDIGGVWTPLDYTYTAHTAATTTTLDIRVSAGLDDAEEWAGGSISLTSSDIEMTYCRRYQQHHLPAHDHRIRGLVSGCLGHDW